MAIDTPVLAATLQEGSPKKRTPVQPIDVTSCSVVDQVGEIFEKASADLKEE